MKRKILTVLSAIFIFVMCGVLSACGDRYKDMEFKIYYAFSADASEWYDASHGISLNYGGTDDTFQIDENTGVGSIYLRVEIDNVKEKYIDEIIVTKLGTSGGVNFSSATVEQDEVFKVDITGNTNSALRFYETNSGKTYDIDLSIYRSLTGIQVDTSIKPAVKVGDMISLMSIKNLYYLPMRNGQTLTNQTGVNYQISGIGYYNEANQYVEVRNQAYAYDFMSISEEGVLRVNSNYIINSNEYIVRIRAVSKHNPNIYAEFDVYLVEEQEYTPFVSYTNDATNQELGYSMTLYKDNTDFASVDLTIDTSTLLGTSIYSLPVNTIDGQISYEIAVYIDNKRVELDELQEINGLLVESLNADNSMLRITATNDQISINTIKIALELSRLDFSASNAPAYSREITVNKSVLPNNISINDELPILSDLHGSMTGIIYSTNSSSYQGLALTLLAVPTNANTETDIYITANENVIITGSSVVSSGTNTYRVKSGETIYVRIRDNVSNDQRITISTQVTPSIFENQSITERFVEIEYTLRKVVTANSIEVYSDATLNNSITNGALYIDARNNTDAYLKVYYTGTTLETSSISLQSSNENIKFANNSNKILLNDPTIERTTGLTDANGTYDLFRVSFPGVASVEESVITVTAGDETVGVETEFTVYSVYLLQEDSLVVQSSSRDVTTFDDVENGHFNFAVVKNQLVNFEILGRVQGALSLSNSGIVNFNIEVNTDYNSNYGGNYNFSTDALRFNKLGNSAFSLTGVTGSRTTVLSLTVSFYTRVNNAIELTSKTIYVDVAVYDPISNINISVSANEIVYINEFYEEASTSDITFSSYASNYSAASSSVVFSGPDGGEIVKSDASQLMVEFNRDLYVDDTIEVYLINGDEEIAINDETILKLDLANILSGTLHIKLTGVSDYNSLTLSLTALRFGAESNVSVSTTILFAEHEAVDGITVSGDNIVQNGVDSYYIYMSFIDVADNGSTSTQFTATPYYLSNEPTGLRFDDLTYELYQVQQDQDGNIMLDGDNQAIYSKVSNSRLNISIDPDTHIVTIQAYKNLGGGLFRLVLASMDSYDSMTQTYTTTYTLFISISDGTMQNKYMISTPQDLYNINNDLSANYVLRNNITASDIVVNGQTISIAPIGGLNEFNGTLSGTVQNLNSDNEVITSRYKITLMIKNTASATDNNVYTGLFSRLGADAKISDLDIDVNFDTSTFNSTAGGSLNIGAIAGANVGGTISGVNVVLLGGSDNIIFDPSRITTTINFGGMVGLNAGYINLQKCTVSSESQITITTNANVQHNIGMVVGTNSGEIYGSYLGKESLNNVNYTIIANLVVVNTSFNLSPIIYMGAVAGRNSGGYIHNIIAGGLMRAGDQNANEAEGFVGGIVGYSTDQAGSSISVKGIETVAVLGMDIFGDNSRLGLAGIVGQSENSTITDVRVLASKVAFDQSDLTTYGRIVGGGTVAGIIANSTNDEIMNASVESFIANSASNDLFYMLHSSSNRVAGLVYISSNTNLNNSFIAANINTNTNLSSTNKIIYLTSNANETNVYFLGRVNNFDQVRDNILARDTGSGYHVVYSENYIIDFNASAAQEINLSDYFTATWVNESNPFYTVQSFLTESDVTSENFDSLKENLYVLSNDIYEKVQSDDTFDDTYDYYLFDSTLWTSTREGLYIADDEGYLVVLNDYNFNPNMTYYSVEDVNVRNYYILDLDGKYAKNEISNIKINTPYYELEWKTENNNWQSDVMAWTGSDTNSWDISTERNYISIYEMNFYFPYIVETDSYGNPIYDNEGNKVPLMIERPTEIQANINADYVIEINSTFIDSDYEIDNFNVTSTTIINYHNDINNPLNNETYNRYNIVNTASTGDMPNGLVDLNVIPSNAQGGVRFEIVRGSAYAYINSQNQIVFTGVSGANPIVVRCYSLFNEELEEYVIFFTQYGLSNLVLTSNSVYEADEEGVDFELYTHTGANSTLVSINAENIFEGHDFATILEAGINNYLSVQAASDSTNSVLNIVNANSTNGIMIEVANTEFEGNMVSEIIEFTLKLNLTEYFGEEYYPSNSGIDQYLDLASSNLRVLVYKTATKVEIEAGDYSVQSNANIAFDVNLHTGYIGGENSSNYVNYTTSGNNIILNETNKDTISLVIEAVSGQDELEDLLVRANVNNIVDLFEFDFSYTLFNGTDNETLGYTYTVGMRLKDEFDYRYITSSIEFRLTVYGANNTNIQDSILIKYNPTELSTVRIENYTATNVTNITNYTSLIESNTTETSIISPGGFGGVMMIYLEPSYSNIVSASLTSTTLYVPSLGRNVSIIFEQLVRNEDGDYETVYPNNETIDGGINLRLVSSVDAEGNYSYNGIIYIHTQMDKFVGMSGTLDAVLNVETNDGKIIEQSRTLLTEYLPGATLSYDGLAISTDEYLIQKDTYNNEVDIQVYGYQFNSNPNISFVWKLNAGDTTYTYDKIAVVGLDETSFEERKLSLYTYNGTTYVSCGADAVFDPDENYYEDNRNIIIDNEGQRYNILDYLSYRFEDDYSQVIANPDGSYTMTVLLNVAPNIPAGFEMKASLTLATSGSLITSDQEDSLIFYPVDYLVNSITSTSLTNGNLNIAYNRTSSIDFYFGTENANRDLSEEIYNKMLNDISITNLASLFSYINGSGEIVQFSDDLELHPEFSVNVVNRKLSITGHDAFYRTIEFSVHYGYVLENGQYVLKFGTMSENSLNRTLEFSFVLNIYANTTEENAIPIYSVDDIFDPDTGACLLGEDADYILMDDIVIDNLVPIDVNIASLDGNNKVIKIRSFAVGVDRTEYGLFANIGTYQDVNSITQTTILKNVIVDYSEFNSSLNLTSNDITDITFGGLVANNNGGLIYNCDVLNLGTTTKTIDIILDNSTDVNIVFGGLVGNNAGIITNSRVGRLGYTKITANEDSETSVQVAGSAINFVIGNSSLATGQGFVATAGGFVGNNTGTIATSYVANTGLTNYSTAPEGTGSNYSMTAGFVGENSGTISYSYVKALESTISETNPYSTGMEIKSPTNGNVAGFVYQNSGNINNSFANTVLTSQSAYVAGFVYNNQQNGVISESYAACTLNGVDTANDASEQPFVGVSNSDELLSFGTLENVYYLIDTSNSFIVKTEEGKDQATGLNQDNFNDSDNLNGFVFIISNSRTERNQGVWSYYNQNNSYRILPELTNANQIAHSYRYLLRQEGSDYIYSNAVSYALGSINNPYIIRSVEEYNSIMLSGGTDDSMTGYVRFINNIDFASDETAIQTRVNFTLGDIEGSTITSVEGNGMTISGIYLDVGNSEESSIGLFANIENTYIKNLNLEFASTQETDGQFSSLSAIYSGGLAGQINNSVIINIDLNGASTTISGQNFAGGLAGIITGKSLIYGIDSNLSVKAVNTDTHYYMYYNEPEFNNMRASGSITYSGNYSTYLTQLSFAGGIAGVIDIEEREYVEYNLSYINIYGNEMYDKTSIDANILADYAGGVAGYAGSQTESLRLKYYVGKTNLIRGQFAVGGLFAVSSGNITASQVTAEEDEQYVYDTTLGQYILDIENGEETQLDTANAGNLNLLETYRYGGGLIGIAINSNINSTYSKVGFKVGRTIGGLIGVAVGANVVYSYAIPYVNIDDTYLEKVGGLIGAAYGVRSGTIDRNQEVSEYIGYLTNILGETNKTTDIQFTFSTLLLDKDDILTKNVNTNDYINFDYVSADYGQLDGDSNGFLTSNKGSSLLYVYAGRVSAYDNIVVEGEAIVKHSNAVRADDEYIRLLYDLSEDNIEQVSTFNNIFSGWSTTYWTLNAERYFPLLLNENVENYIEISNPDDFYQLINNPSGSFMIVEDIDMTDWCNNLTNSNYIFDIEFTGILIGEKEDGSIPVLSNLYLNARNSGNAGLFRQTTDATIRNITIQWGENPADINENENGVPGSVILTNTIDTFGGVSSVDNGSLFSNLTVRIVPANDGEELSLFNSNNGSISGFGGIVGSATDSNILNCTFSGRVDAKLVSRNQNNIIFGGIVGESDKTDISGSDSEEESNMSIMNSNIGINTDGRGQAEEKTVFNLSLSNSSASNAYIGGAVGHANNTAISSISVGNYSYETDYRRIQFNITLDSSNTNNYLGGAVGQLQNSQLSSVDAITTINVSGEQQVSEGTTNWNNSIAGLVGYYSLAGSGNDSLNINNANTSANINFLDETSITNLYVSSGIGYAYSANSTELNIRQSLFTGNINSETETILEGEGAGEVEYITCTLNNVYAGGVVAFASSQSNLVLNEVMSTTDITIGGAESTTKLYAGGLIGSANVVNATNVATTGKIVPITYYSSDSTQNEFYVGGFIGYASSSTIRNAYSLTSILADSLTHSAIQDLNINALFGGIANQINTEYVYYSSDYALFTESSDAGYNLTAYTLTRSNVWRADVNNGLNSSQGFWAETNVSAGTYYLPFIASLSEALVNYGVMRQVGSSYTYLLSALNPIIIESATANILQNEGDSTFTYYILSNNIEDSAGLSFTNASGVTNGVLKGILIGGEKEYNVPVSSATTYTDPNDSTFVVTGLIPKVAKHSAISNLHIKLKSNTLYERSNISGLIAGYNEGVIFNSSVQGIDVKLSVNNLGLITGRNAGMVSYSYSTAEIVEVSGTLSGITYENQGMILSCYFTGYINNAGSITLAAGIIIRNIQVTGTNTYLSNFVYNSYMAGVIELINGENSFIANSSGMNGANNYIDSLANIESVMINSDSNTILSTTTTANLMSADVLSGSWYHTANKINNNYYLINKNSEIYGYNYLYPTYRVRKISSSTSTDWTNPAAFTYVDNNYQLYTGNGVVDTSLDTTSISDYEKVVNALSGTENTLTPIAKQNIMRIPHLGVLSAIQSLALDYVEEDDVFTNSNLYYVLIYDIDGRGRSTSSLQWESVGLSKENAEQNKFYNGSQASFTGFFISNKNYNFSELTLTNSCQVSGLSSGIFANIKNAYFGFLKLGGGAETLSNTNSEDLGTGLLGININPTIEEADTTDNVIVNKVQFVQNTDISASGIAGGLFGTIESGNVLIKDLVTYYIDAGTNTRPAITFSEGARVGLIAGSAESGNIKLLFTEDGLKDEENLNEENDSWYVRFDGSNIVFAGGLFGLINNSGITIDASHDLKTESNNKINIFTGEDGVQSLGGIVGLITGSAGNIASISNLTVLARQISADGTDVPLNIKVFGGLVSNLGSGTDYINNSTVLFTNCGIDLQTGLKISSVIDTQNNVGNYFGLLSAKINGGVLNVEDYYIENGDTSISYECSTTGEEQGTSYQSSRENTQGAGMLVGYQSNANFTFDYVQDTEFPTLHFTNGYNLGGIVGVYLSGSIGIVKGDNSYTVNLYGTSNVGGAIGLVDDAGDSDISNIIMENTTVGETTVEYWNFITDETTFATLYADSTGAIYQNRYNWGGMFGYYQKASLQYTIKTAGAGDEIISEPVTIVNANVINVGATSSDYIKYIYNIGGIAGRISTNTTVVNDLENKADIGPDTTATTSWGLIDTNEYALNFAALGNQINNTIRMINVGGIIGYVSGNEDGSTNITDIKNSATTGITGYQNVGGLIGYVGSNINVKNTLQYEILEDTLIVAGNMYYKNTGTEDEPVYELYVAKTGDTGLYTISADSIATSGNVVGVLNVGGAFGHFTGNTVSGIWTESNVYGNASVGGLIGYVTNASSYINGNVVAKISNATSVGEPAENSEPVEVKGIYLSIARITTTSTGSRELGYEYYIPTSVGGFIGTAEAGILENNEVYNTNVNSTAEGTISQSTDNSNNVVISTISNNMYTLQFSGGTSNPSDPNTAYEYYDFDDRQIYQNNATTDFNELASGFGGFIGSTTSDVAFATHENNLVIESNKIQVNIEAQMGVNVGAYYGTYYAHNSLTIGGVVKYILTPTLMGDVEVSGGYNVGAIIGYYSGVNLSQYSLSEATGNGKISMQNAFTGMYIGGLFGKLVSNEVDSFVMSDRTDVSVKINVANSYYAGGLVGRLEVTGNASFDGSINANIAPISDTITAQRFGGLLGMLKVSKSGQNIGYNVTVTGEHQYAFTINTIENSNYDDGTSSFEAQQGDSAEIILSAMATYINLDTFNVSPTSNSTFYSNTANNPTRTEDSWGWARDYTMFKTIQRCVPASENNGEWDAISQVYDASNITYVATINNLRLTTTPLYGQASIWTDSKAKAEAAGLTIENNKIVKPEDEELLAAYDNCRIIESRGDNEYIFNPNYICYTIYEEFEGSEKLYSAIGIAEPYFDESGEYGTPTYTETGGGFLGWLSAITGWSDGPETWIPLQINYDSEYQGLTYIDYDAGSNEDSGTYKVIGKNEREYFWPTDKSTRDYFCTVDNYYRSNTDGGKDNETNPTYFMFTYFYENSTINADEHSINSAEDHFATSGSMFEVNGLVSDAYDERMKEEAKESTYPWLKPIQFVVEWAPAIIFGGVIAVKGVVKLGKTVFKKLVKKAAQQIQKVGMKKFLRNIGGKAVRTALKGAFVSILLAQSMAGDSIELQYYEIRGESIGYMSESYKREIVYENGKLKTQIDKISSNNSDVNYIYYSTTRPNDYYSKRYFVYYQNGMDGDEPNYETTYLSSVEGGQIVEDDTSLFNGAIKFTYNGADAYAYEYYIYQDGAYYVLMDSIETTIKQVQLPIDDSLMVYNDYVTINGYYYARGTYNGTNYEYNQNLGTLDNAMIKEGDGSYSINGEPWSDSNGLEAENSNYNLTYSINKDRDYSKLEHNGVIQLTYLDEQINYYYGYGYMKNAYYTANGIGIDYEDKMYGTFTYDASRSTEGLRLGIDYVVLTYTEVDEDNNPIVHRYNYFINSITNASASNDITELANYGLADSFGSLKTLNDEPDAGDSINVKLYPNSFDNPYASSITNSQDNNYYLVNKNNSGTGIQHATTYYYYEGGYIAINLGTEAEPELLAYQRVIDFSEYNGNDESLKVEFIPVYNSKGEMVFYSYNRIKEYLQNGETNMYTDDITVYTDEEDIDLSKVENQYRLIDDNILYAVISDKQIINGVLSEISISMPNTESYDFNDNKYLMNDALQFYTRYKFLDSGDNFGETGWTLTLDDGNTKIFYLYVEGQTNPNPGYTTYLVEGCRIILGGKFYREGTSETIGGINVAY